MMTMVVYLMKKRSRLTKPRNAADHVSGSSRKYESKRDQAPSTTTKEFLKKYFYKKGFLDGTPGLISALHSATAVFRAHALVWDRQNRISRAELERQVSWATADRNG